MAIDVVDRHDEILHQTFFGSAVPFPIVVMAAIFIPVDENFTMPFRKDQMKKDFFSAPPEEPIGGSAGIISQPKQNGTILDGNLFA